VTSHVYVVGLGSNLGARVATFEAAARLLDARRDCAVRARSPIYTSQALRAPEQPGMWKGTQPDYLNAALAVHSALPPAAFLRVLLELEAALGRERRERWGPRVLDLDCLWGDEAVASDALTLPHPELSRRSFALAPLLDVAGALGAAHASTVRAQYAPVLAALDQAPQLYSATFSEPALRLEAREHRAGDALQLRVRVYGPLEEAAAALLGAIGARLTDGAPPCTQLGAHVSGEGPPEGSTPALRLAALVADAVQRVRAGLCFGLASVAAQLAHARFIGCVEHPRKAFGAIDVQSVEVTGHSNAEVCASASLMLSKLGDSPRDSLS
jgi:2-amino-4-hydroxy-6-hydroxymethyldihydropteridine diphosphokinase